MPFNGLPLSVLPSMEISVDRSTRIGSLWAGLVHAGQLLVNDLVNDLVNLIHDGNAGQRAPADHAPRGSRGVFQRRNPSFSVNFM